VGEGWRRGRGGRRESLKSLGGCALIGGLVRSEEADAAGLSGLMCEGLGFRFSSLSDAGLWGGWVCCAACPGISHLVVYWVAGRYGVP